MFYLLVALSQFLIPFKVGFLAAFLVPLCLTVGVAMGKELLEDLMRQQQDSKINQRQYKRLDAATGKVVLTKSYQIRVGDIIRLGKGERCPADMVIIYTTDKTGQVLIQTDELDGATENKMRQATEYIYSQMDDYGDIRQFI